VSRRKRTDANQSAVVDALRRCGWFVHVTSHAGDGYPDLTIARGGRLLLVEVKDGSKPPSARALTPDEARVHQAFASKGVAVRVVESVEQACRL
jgi:hypothetical protein